MGLIEREADWRLKMGAWVLWWFRKARWNGRNLVERIPHIFPSTNGPRAINVNVGAYCVQIDSVLGRSPVVGAASIA